MSRARLLRAPERAMIAVADAGYALEADDETWLRGVLEAASPLLDHGSFVHGYLIDLKTQRFRSAAAVALPEGADFEQHVRHAHPPVGDPDVSMAAIPASLTTSSEVYGLTGAALARRCYFPPGFGVEDCVALGAADPSGIACAMMGAVGRTSRIAARDQARWGRVAAHLAAALRLRERLRAAPHGLGLDDADALLDARTQRLEHASDVAASHLGAIRSAAEVLAARHTTDDPARLVAAWRALVAGRWSLVDGFDTDGKRFFVLRKNEPSAPGPQVLTGTQRAIAAYVAMGHSNKAIAYHLGLAESSVSRAVDAVCQRLAIPSRAALAQLGAALGAHPGASDA